MPNDGAGAWTGVAESGKVDGGREDRQSVRTGSTDDRVTARRRERDTVSLRFRLTRLEYDVAWTRHTEQSRPAVLDTRHSVHNQHDTEKAWESLRDKGFAVRHRLDADLETVFELLRSPEWEVDARVYPDESGESLRALGAAKGRFAVLAVLDAEHLIVKQVDISALTSSVVRVLPELPRGRGPSAAVPAADLEAARAVAGGDTDLLAQELVDRGNGAPAAQKFAQVLGGLLRVGRFGAAHIERGMTPDAKVRADRVISTYDTTLGRYQLVTRTVNDGLRCSLTPADYNSLTRDLSQVLHGLAPSPSRA
ncbi:ESX secretion-associated protein EspG [Pseudonocardiaceae bacterium YIM PH 21723]|nr:ESX secretion-associated protein EspG [Pseudonocardiaceae bacterium YIM PH 21723]